MQPVLWPTGWTTRCLLEKQKERLRTHMQTACINLIMICKHQWNLFNPVTLSSTPPPPRAHPGKCVLYIYIYTHTPTCIYIYRERERGGESLQGHRRECFCAVLERTIAQVVVVAGNVRSRGISMYFSHLPMHVYLTVAFLYVSVFYVYWQNRTCALYFSTTS